MTFVLTLEGVLQQPNGAPNIQGFALYHALASQGRLAILCGEDKEKANWFLATNDLVDHLIVVPERMDSHPSHLERRSIQLSHLMQQGHNVELVIEPDPEVVAHLHGMGIPALLYLHPKFSQPSFRPDWESEATPWSKLIEAVNYQEQLKAQHVFPTYDEEDDED